MDDIYAYYWTHQDSYFNDDRPWRTIVQTQSILFETSGRSGHDPSNTSNENTWSEEKYTSTLAEEEMVDWLLMDEPTTATTATRADNTTYNKNNDCLPKHISQPSHTDIVRKRRPQRQLKQIQISHLQPKGNQTEQQRKERLPRRYFKKQKKMMPLTQMQTSVTV